MSVSPANQLVTLGGGELVTCVRQRTSMDAIAKVSLRADTDCLLVLVRSPILSSNFQIVIRPALAAALYVCCCPLQHVSSNCGYVAGRAL